MNIEQMSDLGLLDLERVLVCIAAGAPRIGTATMLRTQYVVVPHDGLWEIRSDGRNCGSYHDQPVAIRAAIDAAHSAGENAAFPPRVLVQSTRSAQILTVVWTLGQRILLRRVLPAQPPLPA